MLQWCQDRLPIFPRFFVLTIALEVAPLNFVALTAFSPEFHSFFFAVIAKGTDCSELLTHIVNICQLRVTPVPQSCLQASIPHLGSRDFVWHFSVSGANRKPNYFRILVTLGPEISADVDDTGCSRNSCSKMWWSCGFPVQCLLCTANSHQNETI